MLKNEQVLLGSHVKMSGSDMFLGSVNEALSYGANSFMLYTGAPQNTKRKEVSELNVPAGRKRMEEAGISRFIVHAPYIINLGNAVKPETFELGVEFLIKEMNRSAFMGGETLVLHPGSHVGEGVDVGIKAIIKGLNEVLSAVPEETKKSLTISLETMAGKGSEVGRSFEELAMIFDGVADNDRLRVCFDTCHTWDAGYNIKDDFDGVINTFDHILGIDRIAAFHINDSKNPMGAAKDRHANIGDGFIGEDALRYIVFHDSFANVPKVLETPYIGEDAPYKAEIARLRKI